MQGVSDSIRSWGRETWSSLHLSDSVREKQHSNFRVPLLHKPQLVWQGSIWSLRGAAPRKPRQDLEHHELWYIKGENTPRAGGCCILSVIEADFRQQRWCWSRMGRAAAPGHSCPQQGCDPNRTPGHSHCHFHPRKPNSVTGLQGKAMPGQQLLPNPIALRAAEIYGTERSRILQSVLGRPEEGNWKFTAPPGAARRLQDTDIRWDSSAGGEAQSRLCAEKEICICSLQLLEVKKNL